MTIEVDQSGKVEQLDTDTVIAYASEESSRAMYIKAGTKRKIISYFRKTLIPQNEIYPIFFAILVFILIQPLKRDVSVKIDEEYTGKENTIRETLEKLLKGKFGKKRTGTILFGQIGKHSTAHVLAWKVHRMKQRKGHIKVNEEEVLQYLK